MASLANIQDAINNEKFQSQTQAEDRPPITTTTNAPEIERSESAHPPGAWVDDDAGHNTAANDQSHGTAGIGNSIMDALGMAGSTAAQYLPAGLVNSVVGYAPGVSGPSKPTTGSTPDVSHTVDATSATTPAPGSESASGTTTSVGNALGAAGSTAAQYLPASLVNSVAGYAPGVSGPANSGSGNTTNPNYTSDTTSAPAHTSQTVSGSTSGVKDTLSAAGSTAAQYLPTSLVNSVAGYAPGISGPANSGSGSTTNTSYPSDTTSTPGYASQSASGVTAGVKGALDAAGSAAAQYLPTSVVNSVAGYAPGVSGPPKSSLGSATDVSNTFDAISTPGAPTRGPQSQLAASKDQFVFKSSQADLNTPVGVNKDLGWQAPTPARGDTQDSLPDMSINKDSGSEVPSRSSTQDSTVPFAERVGLDTAAQFGEPDVLTPLSPQSIPSATNVGAGKPTASFSGYGHSGALGGVGRPAATVSTTAVSGHSSVRSGTEAPPPSAATLLSPSSQGPLSSNLPLGTPTPPAGLGAPSTTNNTAPSSVVSVKSGVVGSGPTEELGSTLDHSELNANKSLPPTPAGGAMQDGVTPRGNELEEDLQYLAPHIRQQNSTAAVPTASFTHYGSVGTGASSAHHGSVGQGSSRFDEGALESGHPTPASDISDSHSRESSVSEGGTRRVSLVKRIRGEAKVIAGKIKKDEGKVAEGKAMMHGEI